ncbi:MAG: hypothetical protein M0Q93_13130, partial [Terrimicrobiaceae bacterium]|nr:hypothetical protein [Terrimicrobiaceae bacterium]
MPYHLATPPFAEELPIHIQRGDDNRYLAAAGGSFKAFSFKEVFADHVVGKRDFHGGKLSDERPGSLGDEAGFEGDE